MDGQTEFRKRKEGRKLDAHRRKKMNSIKDEAVLVVLLHRFLVNQFHLTANVELLRRLS
jgi:hypothetical protein